MHLARRSLPWRAIDPDKALPWVEKRVGLTLAESQVAAIRLALVSKVLVMTGGPGVGKTTIVNAILRVLAAKGVKMLLCAPTGRAAKRITEATSFEAKTIHRLLEVDPRGGGFKRNCHRQWETDPSGTLNLTHRIRWFLREGGADAEGGGADGIGDFEEARGQHPGSVAVNGTVAQHRSAVFARWRCGGQA
jgi:hypothetical protein